MNPINPMNDKFRANPGAPAANGSTYPNQGYNRPAPIPTPSASSNPGSSSSFGSGNAASPAATPGNTMVTQRENPTRIILADGQAIFRVGISKVFAAEPDIHVVGQADSLSNLRSVLKQNPADVLLLDWNILGGHTEFVPELIKTGPTPIKLIVQGAIADETRMIELYRNGVRGTISRAISPDLLLRCVRKVAVGETWIDNQSLTLLIEAYRLQATQGLTSKVAPRLSPKEISIISYISQGKRNKEIAHHIGTSEQVIKNYLRKIYDKLGVSDRLELALYSLHHDLQKNLIPGAGRATVAAPPLPVRTTTEY
jgi:two-component system nitrate/nitrite response regulator NarL